MEQGHLRQNSLVISLLDKIKLTSIKEKRILDREKKFYPVVPLQYQEDRKYPKSHLKALLDVLLRYNKLTNYDLIVGLPYILLLHPAVKAMANRRRKTFLKRYDPYLRFLALPILFLLYSFALLKFGEHLLTFGVVDKGVFHDNTIRNLSLKLPKSREDVMELASLLNVYKTIYSEYVLAFFCLAYIYKQAFAIPGSFFMALIERHFPQHVRKFRGKVQDNRDRIFFFLLGSRVFPMTPNWLLNIVSPLAGIPGHLFFLSVLIGLIPYNFLSVQAGTMLAQMNFEESFRQNFFSLVAAAALIILPGFIMPRVKAKFSPKSSEERDAARDGRTTCHGKS
ncbi:Transmembrane protein 41A [Sparganum proliferum]